MQNLLRIATNKIQISLLVLLMLVVNLLDGLGLGLFVPIIESLQSADGGPESAISRAVRDFYASIGLPYSLAMVLGGLCFVFVVKGALTLLMRYQSVQIASTIQHDLRCRLYNSLLLSRLRFINNQKQGTLISSLGEHTVRAGHAFFVFAQWIAILLSALVYLSFAFFLSWKLSIVSMVLAVLLFPAISWIGRLAHKYGRMQTRNLENMQHFSIESLQSMKLVKAMDWTPGFMARFVSFSERVRHSWMWTAFHSNSPVIYAQPLSVILLSVLILLGVGLDLSMAILGAFILAFLRLLPALQTLLTMRTDLLAALPSVERIMEIMDAARRDEETGGSKRFEKLQDGIRLENISFGYDADSPVLEDVSLDVLKGHTVALAGPSGAGKTTVADLVLGLYRPDRGRVLLDGVDLTDIDLVTFRQRVAYVPQETVLFNDTIRNNLTLGVAENVTDDELERVCRQVGAWEFVVSRPDGLDTLVGDRGVQLSGGQRQRLALARALLRKPELLILDEATSALDSTNEDWIRQELVRLQQSGEFTILLIAHRYSTIQHADSIYLVQDGKATLLGDWKSAAETLLRHGAGKEIING
jgi:ABC-type multidrug transport system fused ATPase/permease subunit